MTKKVSAVPKGYRTATPCLTVNGVEQAVSFYQQAFGAVILKLTYDASETMMVHANIKIGNSIVSLHQEIREMGAVSPPTFGHSGSQIHLYVHDVEEMWANAIDAGATEISPLTDVYWGDRIGTLIDPFGHRWSLASRVEKVSGHELQKRMMALYGPAEDSQPDHGLAA